MRLLKTVNQKINSLAVAVILNVRTTIVKTAVVVLDLDHDHVHVHKAENQAISNSIVNVETISVMMRILINRPT